MSTMNFNWVSRNKPWYSLAQGFNRGQATFCIKYRCKISTSSISTLYVVAAGRPANINEVMALLVDVKVSQIVLVSGKSACFTNDTVKV
jgi:hypothetical protein